MEGRESNLLDGGAPSIGPTAPGTAASWPSAPSNRSSLRHLLKGLGLDPAEVGDQYDRSRWGSMAARFETEFASRTRAEWVEQFSGTDACVSPVLLFSESLGDAHMAARRTFLDIDGISQPAPAPRFSRTPAADPTAARPPDLDRVVG